MEGYLYKRSDTLKQWRRRWFRLVRNSSWLDYKELPKDKFLRGNIPLVDVTVGPMQPPQNHQNWFCFYVKGPTFVYALAAETSEAAARWMDLIIVASAAATAAAVRWSASASIRNVDRNGCLQPSPNGLLPPPTSSSSPPLTATLLHPNRAPNLDPTPNLWLRGPADLATPPESPYPNRDTVSEPGDSTAARFGGSDSDLETAEDQRSVIGITAESARAVISSAASRWRAADRPGRPDCPGGSRQVAEDGGPAGSVQGRSFAASLGFFPSTEVGERDLDGESGVDSMTMQHEKDMGPSAMISNGSSQLANHIKGNQHGTSRSASVAHTNLPNSAIAASASAIQPPPERCGSEHTSSNHHAVMPRGSRRSNPAAGRSATSVNVTKVHPLLRVAPRHTPVTAAGAHVANVEGRSSTALPTWLTEEHYEGLLSALATTGSALQVSERQLEVTQAAAAIDARQLACAYMHAQDISSQAHRSFKREKAEAQECLRETEERLRREKDAVQAELNNARTDLEGAHNDNAALQEEVERLKLELAKATEHSAEVSKKVEALERSHVAHCAELEAELAELRSKVKGAEETLMIPFWGTKGVSSKA